MSNLVYAEVPVGDASILSFSDGNGVYVPLRHLCEKLGLTWQNEHRKIQKDPILSKAVIKLMTALSGGQEQLCLPLKFLPGWLFKVNLNTIAEPLRPRFTMIQLEGYDALSAYWMKGAAINPRMGSSFATSGVGDVLKLIDAIKRETNPAARALIYGMLEQAGAARGVVVPALAELSTSYTDDEEAAKALARIDALVRERPQLDVHRAAGMVAVRMREIEAAGVILPKHIRAALRRHPRFIKEGAVNSPSGKHLHCWVFAAT